MEIFPVALLLATFLCSLVAGFLFAFAVVAMPGIKTLNDAAFIRSFQAMDRVIQNNQPLFILVWVGSVVALIASAVLGFRYLDGSGSLLLLSVTAAYLLGVQAPTIAINIPLNNRIQAFDVDAASAPDQQAARQQFEPRWNRWNVIRTSVSSLVSALLILLLLRM